MWEVRNYPTFLVQCDDCKHSQKMDFFNNVFCSICEEIIHLPQKISALFMFTKITLEEAFSEPCQVSKMESFLKIVFGR